MVERKRCTAVVLAAGQGRRMGGTVAKQYLEIGGRPLLYYTLRAFERSPLIDGIVLAVGDEAQIAYCKKEIVDAYDFQKVDMLITGGRERYDSVWRALCAMRERPECREGYVFIHDGARPVVTEDILRRCLDAAVRYGSGVAGMPAKDTVKLADEAGFALETPPRDRLWIIQTPQTFLFSLIYEAYRRMEETRADWEEKGFRITDDAMVAETFTGQRVKLVEGSYETIKVTTPEDMILVRTFLDL